MNILFTLVAAPLIGFFVKQRSTAVALYLAAEASLFAFQCLALLLAWMAGEGGPTGAQDQGAFGPAPTGVPISYDESELYAYGLVNLVVVLVGIGLTTGLNVVARRRASRKHVIAVG